MLYQQFLHASFEEQTSVLYHKAIRIGGRKDNDHTIVLFQVDGYYAELYFHRKKNEITGINAFTSVDFLEPYLQKIDISGLLHSHQ